MPWPLVRDMGWISCYGGSGVSGKVGQSHTHVLIVPQS
jgi:hypothetical protein